MAALPRRAVCYFRAPAGRGQGEALAAQSRACARFARARGLVVLEPFVESARSRRRGELVAALARCDESGAALLVLALAAVGGDLAFLEAVLEGSVALYAADAGAVRRPVLRLLRDVARHQRATASQRSREALRAARGRGARLGSPRPEVGSRAGVAALRAGAEAHAHEVAPALAELLLSNPGASLRELAEGLDALGVPTPRRGRWGPSAVRNALRRGGLERAWRGGSSRASQFT